MVRARVVVTLKEEVSDPQGITIQQTVSKLDYPEVKKVRVGKYFEIELDGDESRIKEKLDNLCHNILSNPVVENYRYEIQNGSGGNQ